MSPDNFNMSHVHKKASTISASSSTKQRTGISFSVHSDNNVGQYRQDKIPSNWKQGLEVIDIDYKSSQCQNWKNWKQLQIKLSIR